MGSQFVEAFTTSVLEKLRHERQLECLVTQYRSLGGPSPWNSYACGETVCHQCQCPLVIAQYNEGMYETCVYPECNTRFCKIDNCLCGLSHDCHEHMVDGEFCQGCADKFEYQQFK